MMAILEDTTSEALGAVLHEYMAVTERLQATHETLAREVVRLRGELEHKNRELERRERLAALGELAAGMAHEVRNPLGAIQLYNGLLRRRLGSDAEAARLLDRIDDGIRAIDDVVQDGLALAPRGGALLPRRLKDIVGGAVELCRPALESRGIRLITGYERDDIEVPAEEPALQRVVMNLIANAIDASPPRGVVRVLVSDSGGGEATIRVCDEGGGVPPQILDKIFDPFFTTKAKGTGLGLSIAHRLVEAHGGRLSVANRAEGGAEFSVVLPSIRKE